MKKSEMIDIIYNILDRYLDGNARTSQATYILMKIEEAGMLPPLRSYTDPRDSVHVIVCNEWEPEND